MHLRSTIIAILLTFALLGIPQHGQAGSSEETIEVLEEATGITQEVALNAKATMEERFKGEVDVYLTMRKLSKNVGVADDFADSVYDGGRFDYNVKLSVLKIYYDHPKTRDAMEPVVQRLCARWQRTKWMRRFVVGGVIIGAAVFTVHAGINGVVRILSPRLSVNSGVKAGLALFGQAAAVDMGAGVLYWYLMKVNPEVVFGNDIAAKVLESLEEGETVIVEDTKEAPSSAESLPEADQIHHQR